MSRVHSGLFDSASENNPKPVEKDQLVIEGILAAKPALDANQCIPSGLLVTIKLKETEKQMSWFRTLPIATLALSLGVSVTSAKSAKKSKATTYELYYGVASTPDVAFLECAKNLGAKNCAAPHGGCNFYDWQWGAIAAGLRQGYGAYSTATRNHKSANAAKAEALKSCNKVTRKHGYSCKTVHVWNKGCGYISVGCAGARCPPLDSR